MSGGFKPLSKPYTPDRAYNSSYGLETEAYLLYIQSAVGRSSLSLFFVLSLLGGRAWSDPGISSPSFCKSHFQESAPRQLIVSEPTGLKAPEILYTLRFSNDLRFNAANATRESLLDLFQMLGHTQFLNTSEKLTLEKGTLFLARKIDDLLTAQAEYVYSKPGKALHLSRLSIINSKSGHEQILTKEPLDYTGQNLVKNDFNLVFEKGTAAGRILPPDNFKLRDEVHGPLPGNEKAYIIEERNIHSSEIAFPPSISGEAFNRIRKWSMVVPYLDHAEINVIDSITKQRWAITKGKFRRFVEFAKDRFFKQAFGLLVVYALVDGTSHFGQDIAKYVVNLVGSRDTAVTIKIEENHTNGATTNREMTFPMLQKNKKQTEIKIEEKR